MYKNNIKIIVIISLLTIFNIGVFGQCIKLMYDTILVKPDSAINVNMDINQYVTVPVFIKNICSDTMNVKVTKIEKSVLSGSENYFCWGNCYSSTVYTSKFSIQLQGGETNTKDFYADYNPNGKEGTTTMIYVFFDMNDPKDSAYVTIKFNSKPSGISDKYNDIKHFYASPNPANNIIYINYALPENINYAKIVISDIYGKIYSNENITSNENIFPFNVSELSAGIYYYSILTDTKYLHSNSFSVIK